MNSDIVMIALVLAGISLTIAYFYVAVLLWRQRARIERKRAALLRSLHTDRLRSTSPELADPAPSDPAGDRQIAA